MTDTAILERRQHGGTVGDRLNHRLTREVETILEEAERSNGPPNPKVGRWYYTVPQAGVRYYSF